MNDRTDTFIFVGFWKRVLARLLDAGILLPLIPVHILLIMPWEAAHRTIMPGILSYLISTPVMLWLVMRFGGTPGKLILGIRIVDVHGNFLSMGRAVRRIIFPELIAVILGFLFKFKAYNMYPEGTPYSTFLEIGAILNLYGQPYDMIKRVFACCAIAADLGVILLNHKKRTLHDFIAGSYVITEDSYRRAGKRKVPRAD